MSLRAAARLTAEPVLGTIAVVLIGLSGPYAAGKGEVAAYLVERTFTVVSLSDVLRDELRRQGLGETRERMIETGRRLRERHGAAVLAEILISRFVAGCDYAVDSIRHPAEVEALRACPTPFLLFWVDAPLALRFARLRRRARAGDPESEAQLRASEARERGGAGRGDQQLAAVAELADRKLWNDGDIEKLRARVAVALAEVQ